jgi:hypothetical protein
MFRAKTVRRVRKAVSPLIAATDISGVVNVIQEPLVLNPPIQPSVTNKVETPFENNIQNFFVAESAAMSVQKPWLRLERGIRLQKFRSYAQAYPGLTVEEQETLYKVLMKANDAKLLNTKQQINYENGVILAIKGLKVIKNGDPSVPAVFKIDIPRPTKKNLEDPPKL